MTGRKNRRINLGGRTATVAFSLCLLAVVTMIGMYTVGRTDEKQRELEQQVADAQEQRMQEEARVRQLAEEKQAAASAAAQREKENEKNEKQKREAVELEGEFGEEKEQGTTDEKQETSTGSVAADTGALAFTEGKDKLLWPIAGDIILDYSMDKSVYFATLDQYKYNPAVIIQGNPDESVLCGARGKVKSVKTREETGTTVTVDIGSGYQLVYGQLKELLVKEGDSVKAGATLGYVGEPTKYYAREGANVYFEIQKDGKSIDPMTLLQ